MLSFKLYFLGGGNEKQWTVLRHNGPFFPPEYKPHKIPVIVNNNKIILNPEAEEYATIYAKYLDTDYINNNTFKKNFWKDFKVYIKNENIKSLEEIDFSLIKEYMKLRYKLISFSLLPIVWQVLFLYSTNSGVAGSNGLNVLWFKPCGR